MRCFARKGYHATSIQEIVDELGMAKGSIYFYFKSKEELLLAVVWSFVERMMAGMTVLPEERQLSPREQFRLQLIRHFDYFQHNWEFVMMLMQEPQPDIGQEQKSKLLHEVRERLLRWKRQYILEIYGEAAAPYGWDAAHLLGGMLNEIMHSSLLDRRNMASGPVGTYLLERLDDLMAGFGQRTSPPLLYADERAETPDEEYKIILLELVKAAEGIGPELMTAERRSDLLEAADRLIEELGRPIPDRIGVRSLFAYLKELCVPALRPKLEAVGAWLKIE